MRVDEITDGLNPAPAGRRRAEEIPGDLAELIGLAIAAAEQIDEIAVGHAIERHFLRVLDHRIGLAIVLNNGIAVNRQ